MVRTIVALGEFAGDEGTDVDHVQGVTISVFVQNGLGSLLTGCARQVDDVCRCALHGWRFVHVGSKAACGCVRTATSGEANHDLDRLFRVVSERCAAGQHCGCCESGSKGLCEFHRFLP